MDCNKEKVLNEIDFNTIKNIAFISTVIIGAIHFAWRSLGILYYIKHRDIIHAEKYSLDEEYTSEMRKILKHDKIMVRFDASKDEGFPNAMTPGGNTIIYNADLKALMTHKELIAMFLHEYGHIDKTHNNKLLAFDTSYTILLYSFASVITAIGVPFALLVIWILEYAFGGREFATDLYNIVTSKHQEYVADTYAAKYGYGQHFISAFKKIEQVQRSMVCDHMSNRQCNRIMKDLNKWGTHPRNDRRIKRVTKLILKKHFKTTKDLNLKDLKVSKRKMKKLMNSQEFENVIGNES